MALRTPYDRLPLSQVAQVSQNDPWFTLGMLLAQNYNKNYEDRGTNKAVESLQNSLGPTQEEKDNAEKAYLDAVQSENQDYDSLNKALDNIEKNGLTGYNQMPYSQPAGRQGALKSMAESVGLKQDNPNINNPYNMPRLSNNDKDIAGPAHTQEGQDTIKALAENAAAQRLSNFDIEQWKADQTAQLLKAGRSPEQIEAALNIVMPQAQGIDKRNKEAATLTLLQNAPDLQAIYQLSQSSPEMADLYAKSTLVPASTVFAANQANKRQQQSLANAKELSQFNTDQKIKFQNATMQEKIRILKQAGYDDQQIAAALAGTGKKGSGAGVLGNTQNYTQQINAAKAMLDDEKNWNENFNNQGKPYPYKAQADNARQFLATIYGYAGGNAMPTNNQLQGYIDKYSNLDYSDINATLKQDKELIGYLKNNPNVIPYFEQATGITLPRKQ